MGIQPSVASIIDCALVKLRRLTVIDINARLKLAPKSLLQFSKFVIVRGVSPPKLDNLSAPPPRGVLLSEIHFRPPILSWGRIPEPQAISEYWREV